MANIPGDPAPSSDSALFAEPTRPSVLAPDGPWAIAPGSSWRFMLLGEDGETLLIQGHVHDAAITDVLACAAQTCGWDEPYFVEELQPERTWVRRLTACPTHQPDDEDAQEGCGPCHARPDDPWWDWSTPEGQPDANRDAAGYFPATVINLEM